MVQNKLKVHRFLRRGKPETLKANMADAPAYKQRLHHVRLHEIYIL